MALINHVPSLLILILILNLLTLGQHKAEVVVYKLASTSYHGERAI
jgi:hypothetical protein